ncbi:MAG TPA: PHB depolymerase family esterase, partial [Anaerolineales bacterium]|nr:PHB depolymerase family esterase [Anaerolineales bacterium]
MKTKDFFFLISALIFVSMACRKTANTGVGIQNEYTLNYQNIERSYILYTPKGLDTSKPMPLVFVLHGGGGNAENIIRSSGFNEVADQNGALIVYPNGTGRLN